MPTLPNQTQIPIIQTPDANLVQVQQNVNKVLRNLHGQIQNVQASGEIAIDVAGTLVADVPELNFIAGTGVSISGINNVPLNRVDLTITNTGTSGNSFTTIDTDFGTSPVADSPTDTLTLTSSDGSVVITGSASTDTVNFTVAASASPGFSWGRSGALPSNTYLLNDTVPSNVTGRIVPLTTGTINKAVIACGTASTFDVTVQKRSGVSFIDLFTVSVVSARTSVSTQSQSVVSGDELAVLVSAGSTDNLVVSLIMVGAT